MSEQKQYWLSLHKNYCASWGVVQAVRELFQNAIDSTAEFKAEWEIQGAGLYTLRIISKGITIPAATLVLGVTDKSTDNTKIGNFGEGYKIASLVLLREEKGLTIYNGSLCWKPTIKYAENFDTEVLVFEESENHFQLPGETALEFEITDLTEEERKEIWDSCLHLEPELPYLHQTSIGKIFDKTSLQAGKLFVGGLFICNTNLHYGYDIIPDCIKLERDRQTVDCWDLKFRTKDMWAETKEWKLIGKMLEDEIPDVEYIEHVSSSSLSDFLFSSFSTSYGKRAIPVSSQHEVDKYIEKGIPVSRLKLVSLRLYNVIAKAAGFKEIQQKLPKGKTVEQIMNSWYKVNSKHMNNFGKAAFRKLVIQAKSWHT